MHSLTHLILWLLLLPSYFGNAATTTPLHPLSVNLYCLLLPYIVIREPIFILWRILLLLQIWNFSDTFKDATLTKSKLKWPGLSVPNGHQWICEKEMFFYLNEEHQANPPQPTDPDVYLVLRPALTVFTRVEGGWMDDTDWKKEARIMDQLVLIVNGYNSPWDPIKIKK